MKVLLIAYHFPPTGGAGVQRPLKFARYLPQYGVTPIIITQGISGPRRWAPMDESLAGELDPGLAILRTTVERPKTGFESVWCSARRCLGLVADPMVHWQREVMRLGDQAWAWDRFEVILATMSPFQSCFPAARIASKYSVPWVADLRDPWALDEFQVYPSRVYRAFERRRMARGLRTASLIIMNTPEAARRVRSAFPQLKSIPVTSLTNGYDAGDFGAPDPEFTSNKFTIVHTGHLHTEAGLHQQRHPLLYSLFGRTEPGVRLLGRSHYYLLQALERWQQTDPSIAAKVRLVLVGATTNADRELAARSPVGLMVEFAGYTPHKDTVRWMQAADVLFLPMHSLPPGRRATIVPGKTYEYLASGRPILAAVPEGDARDFVTAAGTGFCCAPDDVRAMGDILRARFGDWGKSLQTDKVNQEFIARFERRRLTGELGGLLKQICR